MLQVEGRVREQRVAGRRDADHPRLLLRLAAGHPGSVDDQGLVGEAGGARTAELRQHHVTVGIDPGGEPRWPAAWRTARDRAAPEWARGLLEDGGANLERVLIRRQDRVSVRPPVRRGATACPGRSRSRSPRPASAAATAATSPPTSSAPGGQEVLREAEPRPETDALREAWESCPSRPSPRATPTPARTSSRERCQPAEEHLLVEQQGHPLVLTMNRPERKNAFSPNMLGRMAEAWEQIDADDDIRVVILTGSTEVFCAGADLKAMMSAPDPGDDYAKRFTRGRRHGLAGAAAPLPAHQAADRRGRGPGHRRRHRDPAGHRHPGGRRVRDLRRRRGAPRAVPARRLDRPAAPADPLHGGGRAAADRPDDHRRARPSTTASSATSSPTARRSTRRSRSPTRSPPTGRSRCKAVLRSLRETEGAARGRGAQGRARDRHADLRHRGREGRARAPSPRSARPTSPAAR